MGGGRKFFRMVEVKYSGSAAKSGITQKRQRNRRVESHRLIINHIGKN